jgi:acyl carrier protein
VLWEVRGVVMEKGVVKAKGRSKGWGKSLNYKYLGGRIMELKNVTDILADFTEMEKSLIKPETKLVADMGLNSLDVVNIVVAFEEKYDIEIPDRVIWDFNTVEDILKYLEKNV